jgi:hypothetical protein
VHDRRHQKNQPRSRIKDEDVQEHESRTRTQDREYRRDKRKNVRWKEQGPKSSDREGKYARTPKLDERGEYRPREQRRKSSKVQDAGFANQMD